MERIRKFFTSYRTRTQKNIIVALVLVLIVFAVVPKGTVSRLFQGNVRDNFRRQALESSIYKSSELDYNLKDPKREDFSRGLSKIVDKLLKQQENGFYVDIGAGDGENNSVSLFFERQRHYDGILVEGNPIKFRSLMTKNRKARKWHANIRSDTTALPSSSSDITPSDIFKVIDRQDIDILMINLHDQEFDFIKAIDFNTYKIRVITVEFQINVPPQKYSLLTDYLLKLGYRVAHHLVTGYLDKKDVVYTKL